MTGGCASDLRTEALDLALKPTIKEGMGIGAGALADVVRVTGTLASPSVGIDTLGSARAALSVAGALLTSGVSLLGETLLTRGSADPHPCKTALGGGAAQRQPPAPKPDAGGLDGVLRRIFK